MFLISRSLKKKGFYNELPNLGNLEVATCNTIGFSDVYATILDKWLNTSPSGILGETFKDLGLFRFEI